MYAPPSEGDPFVGSSSENTLHTSRPAGVGGSRSVSPVAAPEIIAVLGRYLL